MPAPSLYVNGRDLESLGFHVADLKGPWDIPAQHDPDIVLPGRMGTLRTGAATVTQARPITIGAKILEMAGGPRTNDDLEAKVELLKGLLATGLLGIRRANQPTRMWEARCESFQATIYGAPLAGVMAEVVAQLVCTDPLSYEIASRIIGFGATPVPIELGTAPSGGILRIMGSAATPITGGATNPAVTCRDASGQVVHTIGLTRTLGESDYEEIDLDLQTVYNYSGGAPTYDVAAVTSGDIEDFKLSPDDGDPIAGAWPTLEVSAGTGLLFYNRAYL